MSTIKLLECAPTKFQKVGDIRFAYRELGAASGVPVIFLNHLAGVLDNWDPRVVDGIAAKHRVIVFDNRGIGASGGSPPATIDWKRSAGTAPEQENVASMPPGASSLSAHRLMSL